MGRIALTVIPVALHRVTQCCGYTMFYQDSDYWNYPDMMAKNVLVSGVSIWPNWMKIGHVLN